MNHKQEFVQAIVKTLNRENEDRIYHDNYPLDIAFMVSIIDQRIEEYGELIETISKYNYRIQYEDDKYEGYTNGKIEIFIERPEDEKESDLMAYAYYTYHYEIEFLEDERMWGYCTCNEEDEGYNPKYGCCGNSCDWTAPRINVRKIIDMGEVSWDGLERDYWKFKEEFENNQANKNKEVEDFKKQQKREYIEKEIERLKEELRELNT